MIPTWRVDPDKRSVVARRAYPTSAVERLDSVVLTCPVFAGRVVDHFRHLFKPTDTFLDPCAGEGAFYRHLPAGRRDWCEIRYGRDFFDWEVSVDWIVTNPPWRGEVMTRIMERCFERARRVLLVVRLNGALGTSKRLDLTDRYDMRLREVCRGLEWSEAGFRYLDGSEKAREGFEMVAMLWQRRYRGGTRWTRLAPAHAPAREMMR